jgi:hypothetical protein
VYFLSDLWHFEKLHAQLSLRQTSNAQAVATMVTIVWATSLGSATGNSEAPTPNMSEQPPSTETDKPTSIKIGVKRKQTSLTGFFSKKTKV